MDETTEKEPGVAVQDAAADEPASDPRVLQIRDQLVNGVQELLSPVWDKLGELHSRLTAVETSNTQPAPDAAEHQAEQAAPVEGGGGAWANVERSGDEPADPMGGG